MDKLNLTSLPNALKALVLLTVLSICPQGMARN